MQRFVQIGHMLVAAIDGQAVLDEIVGADGEKIDLLGQQIGDQSGRRSLNHDADRHLGIEGISLRLQLGCGLLQIAAAGTDFRHPGNQGEHDAHAAEGAGPQDRPQLDLQQPHLLQGKADAAQPHGRIGLIGQVDLRNELVATDIQGTDGDRMRRHLFHDLPVNANCSSSGGGTRRFMNRNSVRNRPMPSPPCASTRGTFAATSTLPRRTTRIAVQGLRRQFAVGRSSFSWYS